MNSQPIILILRPQKQWGIVTCELKRVYSLGRYMSTEGNVQSNLLGDSQEPLRQLATVCEELTLASLYARYANKTMFKHAKDFWASDNSTVRQHTKRMADIRLLKAVQMAAQQDIPIIYAPTEKSPLHISEQLHLKVGVEVRPVMSFHRHENGVTYRLQLRLDGQLVERLSDHQLTVLGHVPGIFILDGDILLLNEGFNAKLLLPFMSKPEVEIPRKMEDSYFRKFILKNVSKTEIHADGFDIEDAGEQLRPCLIMEQSVDGSHVLTLIFRYGSIDYTPDSTSNGRVMLKEVEGGYKFIRQLRDKEQERLMVTQLLHHAPDRLTGLQMSPPQRCHIRFPKLADMIDWLRHHGPKLREQGFDVVQPSDHPYYIGPLQVKQSDTWNGDWLQTEVTILVDDGRLRIPFSDLRDTILRGEQEYMLPTGEILLIPDEWLKRYGDLLLIGKLNGKKFSRHRCQISKETADGKQRPRSQHPSPAAVPPAALNATLRPYQLTGYQWLWSHFETRTGCCLSDEMGLGKTLQTIAALLHYKEVSAASAPKPQAGFLFTDDEMRGEALASDRSYVPRLPSLVVAPASVVHNWQNELHRFAPTLLTCNYTGTVAKRHGKRTSLSQWDVVLTTYRTLVNDLAYLSRIPFGIVVFDESQVFKTATSQIFQAVSSLNALHRLALSGTPVENNLMELWSLMSVLNPSLLGDAKSFQQTFVQPITQLMEQQRAEVLQRLIAPYFLKRTKEQVLSDLPERQDEVVVCPMTDQQASCYAEELSKARNEYLDSTGSVSERNIHILAALQRLRQIANGEGKINVVFERLEQLRGTSHKVLIFCEYVSLLEQVGNEMQQRGWQYDILTGQTRQREQTIAHFQQTSDCQFFLISLKAGGVGLNLTAADYVFLLDPWWNQAAEEQAIARAHRIGQRRAVFVYRFVSENTLDQQILSLQEHKQNIIDSVMPFICK